VAEAALRELKEETGYQGRILSITPTLTSDAGMSGATLQFAVAEVHLKDGEDMPEQNLGEGEFIEREVLPINQLHNRLLELSEAGRVVDSKLWLFAHGMHFGIQNQARYKLA